MTQPTLAPAKPSCQVKVGDPENSLGHTFESEGKGHYKCSVCNGKFVKIYRFKNEKDKGAPTGFETGIYVTLHSFNKHYSWSINEGDPRTLKPRYADWKIADEESQKESPSTDSVTDVLNTAIFKGVISKTGNWYKFDGSRFNGKKELFNKIGAMQLEQIKNKIQLDART